MTPARLRARRGGGDDADPLPGRARPAARCSPRSAAVDRRPAHPPAAGVVLLARCRSCATSACARSPSSSPATSPGPTRRSPSCTGASTTRSSPSWRSTSSAPRPSSPTGRPAVERVPDRRRRRAELARRRGSTRSSTPGPARSTPARRRSSATSSARWCSACPKEPQPGVMPMRVGRSPCVARGRGLWPTAVRQWRRHDAVAGGGGGRPFLPVPSRDYLRFRLAHPVRRIPTLARAAPMW